MYLCNLVCVLHVCTYFCSLRDCVHTLTSNDIQTGRYSIREVVLPLLGTNTIFPRNKVADRSGMLRPYSILFEIFSLSFWTFDRTLFRLKELLIAAGISLASFRYVLIHVP